MNMGQWPRSEVKAAANKEIAHCPFFTGAWEAILASLLCCSFKLTFTHIRCFLDLE